jgi:hypothetical protein
MDIDDKIDKGLKKLFESNNYTLFAHELYNDDFYMNNAPHIVDRTMIERGLISVDQEVRMLTAVGIEICELGGWKVYKNRKAEHARKEMVSQAELQELNRKQLELSIREMQVNFTQIKYWWLILIMTTVVSATLGALASIFIR